MENQIQSRYQFLIQVLDELESIACKHFRGVLNVQNKAEGRDFDPVTVADKEIETYFREALSRAFPQDSVLGEEFENTTSGNGFKWIIDPIDGTRAFVAGSPTFTTLICLEFEGAAQFAVVSQPFTKERFISHEGKAFWQHQDHSKSITTSDCTDLHNAIISTTFPEVGSPLHRQKFENVSKEVKLVRYSMDGYAYGLLAAGHIDLIIEAGLKPFDYAAPRAVVLAAGGVFCAWDGGEIDDTGCVIAAATQEIADAAIALLGQIDQ